jgi:hypothetical protein
MPSRWRKRADVVVAVAGYLLFAGLLVACLRGYGTRWEFGRLGLPREAIGPDGRYPDGRAADPLLRALATSGWDQELMAGLVLVWIGLMVLVIRAMVPGRRLRAALREHDRLRRQLAEAERRAAGRPPPNHNPREGER